MTLLAVTTLLPFASISAQHTMTGGYAGIGTSNKLFKCDFDRTLYWDTCEAFPPFNPFDPSMAFQAGEWVESRDFENPIEYGRTGTAKVTISIIKNPRNMPLKMLDRRGAVVASLQLNPEGPADLTYKIGGRYTRGRNFTGDFYIIIDRYREVDDGSQQSRKIANWRLYGLRTNGELRALPANGAFRWCAMSDTAATTELPLFATCEMRHQLAALESRIGRKDFLKDLKEALVTQTVSTSSTTADKLLLIKAAKEAKFEMASLPCGVGCCITEFAPDLKEGELALSAGQTRANPSYSPRSAPRTVRPRGW